MSIQQKSVGDGRGLVVEVVATVAAGVVTTVVAAVVATCAPPAASATPGPSCALVQMGCGSPPLERAALGDHITWGPSSEPGLSHKVPEPATT
mmetsp:Transcript_35918/g.101127  ORF Transcript_35918/g.101127 Transcript_35918/m.101127 type:complete len:93 (+) Transcript_35918:758-1036(+)